MIVKYLKAFLAVFLAGTSAGVFFYIRSLPTLRLFDANGADSSMLWAFSSLSALLMYCVIANAIVIAVWGIYAFLSSWNSREHIGDVLQRDAFTYLPLCMLLVSLLQFNSLLTYYFEGTLLLSHSAGYWLLLLALLGVYHAKVKTHGRFLPVGPQRRQWTLLTSPPTWRLNVAVFCISLAIYAGVGIRVEQKLGLGGDEPHYLLITHSLLHDHDLKIRNNYKEKDYQSFFQGELDVHISIAKDGTRYSIHPIGMPVLMIPAYALYGHKGAIFCMHIMGALLALVLFLIAYSHTHNTRLSLLLWAVVSFTPPVLLYASQLYPEIPSALFLASIYYLIQSKTYRIYSGPVILGLLFAYLPWIQQRMILPSVFLLLYHLLLLWRDTRHRFWRKQHVPSAIIPSLCLIVSGVLMAGQNYLLFRNPLPNASYRSVGINEVFSWDIFLHEGLLGLLFDQEAGLLIYAPYFIFLVAGLMLIWRRDKLLLAFLALTIGSIYIPCAGFTLKWRGAWSPVARYMVTQIPLFFIPLCVGVSHATRRIYRYVLVVCIAISAAWAVFFVQSPFSAIMRSRGINLLFERTSDLLDLPRYAPSLTPNSHGSFLLAGGWMVMIALFSLAVYYFPSTSPRQVIRNRRAAESERRDALKYIVVTVAMLLVVCGALTFMTVQPEYMANPEQMRNLHLRTFLSHVNYHAIARHHILQEQPFPEQDIRFSYISREKIGDVHKRGPGFIVTGPEAPFPKGRYTAYFKILVDDNSREEMVAALDVVSHKGSRVYRHKTVQGTDFTAAGEYQLIPLTFEIPEGVRDLETRVYFQDVVTLRVQKIYVEPDIAGFYYNAGLSALGKGRLKEAEPLFLRAAATSTHLLAQYQIGRQRQLEGQWETSIPIFQDVLARAPAFADAYYRLGLAYQRTGPPEAAHQYFQTAAEYLPTHLDAWKALSEVSRNTGQKEQDEAIEQQLSTLYAPQHPYAINFGDQIMFMGYSIDNTSPGKLTIAYYWKTLNDMPYDYTFFVHFKGSKETFQHDHEPHIFHVTTGESQLYPTTKWKIGELVREQFEIDAPAGTFQVELGIWEPEFLQKRLPIISSPPSSRFWRRTTVPLQGITVR